MVHALVESIGLFNVMHCYCPGRFERRFVESFHASNYIDVLFNQKNASIAINALEDFGLVDDSPLFTGINVYVQALIGSAHRIVELVENGYQYVINWDGGRHHAGSSQAAGYCYINGTFAKQVSDLYLKMLC